MVDSRWVSCSWRELMKVAVRTVSGRSGEKSAREAEGDTLGTSSRGHAYRAAARVTTGAPSGPGSPPSTNTGTPLSVLVTEHSAPRRVSRPDIILFVGVLRFSAIDSGSLHS